MLKYKIPQIVTLTLHIQQVTEIKRKGRTVKNTIRPLEYSKRDLNPHSRNGQRILSPSCRQLHRSSTIAIYL